MRISDIIFMCLGNLKKSKIRTALTVIGVVVGTCAIMVMISLGVAMKVSMDNMLASMGDLTVIEVYNWSNTQDVVLDDQTMKSIQEMDGVVAATPFYSPQIDAQLYSGRNDRYASYLYNLVGVYPEAMEQFGYQLKSGSFPTGKEKEFVLVAGGDAAYNFRDTKKRDGFNMIYQGEIDPVTGQEKEPYVNLEEDEFILKTTPIEDEDGEEGPVVEREVKMVGVLVPDWSKGYETSQGYFASIEQVKKLEEEYRKVNKIKSDNSNGQKGYNNAKVKVESMELVPQVEKAIQELGFETYSMESTRQNMQQEAQRQQMMLGGLGGISLFVAAIGIANTMVMSIYERTREIGVMKVLGCNLGNIRSVFLLEAGCIGFMGGVIGVILSYGISFAMNVASSLGLASSSGINMDSMGGITWEMVKSAIQMVASGQGEKISIVPLWLVAVALVFATMIGLISGFYPANRAVKISALEAIKHE